MFALSQLHILGSQAALAHIPEGKVLINTINAHSYNTAQHDSLFAEALRGGDYLLPDGASIVMACRWLKCPSQPTERVAGWDLFCFEMERLNKRGGRCMFMGSSPQVLNRIKQRAAVDYTHIEVITYSPPFKTEFTEADNAAILAAIHQVDPDLLWIGMTAPKQEKWTYQQWPLLQVHCHVGTIGAVFDFYAGTTRRAPLWWQTHSLEWLYRLIKEPRRMWRRYILGNPLFLWNIAYEWWSKR